GRTSSLARQFDRLTALLVELGYLAPDGPEGEELRPTASGLRLRRLFSDRDLLIAQCLEHGAWAGLDPAGLAALVSAAVHETRRDDRAPETIPDPAVDAALAASARLAAALQSAETRHGITPTTAPDPAVAGHALPPGDSVRRRPQVSGLLDQRTSDEQPGPTARRSSRAVRRGPVAQEIDR